MPQDRQIQAGKGRESGIPPFSIALIPGLVVLMAILYGVVPPSVFYDPVSLILIGNTVFVGGVSFVICFIAFKTYSATGRIQVLLLGCGVLTFGMGGVVAAIVRNLPDGANLNVTIYNTGALVGAGFHFAAAFIILAGVSPEAGATKRRVWLRLGYGASVLFMVLLTIASFRRMVPPYFIQGVGPTVLRQWVLGTADILFVFACLVFMATYIRNKERFVYWYGCALALTAISLTAFFIQKSVGSPVGWLGRFSQYVGGVYFLIALVTAARSAHERGTSLNNVLTASLSGVEEKFRALAENAPDAIRRFDRELRHIYVNPAGLRLLGRTAGGVIGRTMDEAGFSEAQCELWRSRILRVFETGRSFEFEDYVAAERGERFLESHCVPEYDAEGRVSIVLVVSRDLTERKQAEAALQESRAKLEAALASMTDAVFISDAQGRLVHFNDAFAAFHKFASKDLCLKRLAEYPEILEVFLPDGAPAPSDMWAVPRALRGETVTNAEYGLRRKDTGETWIGSYSFSPIRNESGAIVGSVVVGRDITEQKRAEEEVRRSNAVLEAFFSASDGILNIVDDQFRYVKTDRITPQYFNLTRETIVGKTVEEVAPDLMREHGSIMREVLDTGQPRFNVEVHSPVPGREGETAYWLASYFPVPLPEGKRGLGIMGIEITEVRKAEERLREAQKLESLGLLAGGVAHDFNNLLVGVIGYASLAQDMLPPGDPAAELLETVVKTGEKAAHLTRQMLAYAGKGRFVLEQLEVTSLVGDMVELIRPFIPKKAEVRLELGEDLPFIEADRSQVQQIVMNLAINAAEAIGSDDGVITIGTRREVVDADYVRRRPEAATVQAGEFVAIEVRDTGCGMDEATRAKIFDPFFSTKFTGRGLGLAAVAGIVRGHKGAIVVSSAPGKGSAFTVLFPASKGARESPQGEVPTRVVQGAGVILIVDDEALVRDLTQKALERAGYTVLAANGGLAAIEILKRHPGGVDLAIVDMSMPGMSGAETVPELRELRPELKVLASSGYSETEAMRVFEGQELSGFVQKPYTAMGIAERVKRVLTKSVGAGE